MFSTSNFDDSYLHKNMSTLKDMNKKLLSENEHTIDKLKQQMDQVSCLTKSDNQETMKTIKELEQQISHLVKSISRAESLIEEKDHIIGTSTSLHTT